MGYLLSSHCAQTTHEIQDSPRQRQHDWSCAKKNIVQPHRKKCWVIPPEANSAFVAAMEDVLAVYMRPHDPERPLVCLDETSKQLVAETRTPIPMKPGSPARHDYEYERHGVANLFMMFAPGGFRREVQPRRQHWFLNEKSGFPFRTPAFCSVSRGQRRLGEKEYRAPSVTPGVALRPRTQAPRRLAGGEVICPFERSEDV